VNDNSNGIPQKVVDKIFQPFFTTKPTGHGTGLGLSLSYDIIKAHGGEIKVNTKEKEFTEFTILLLRIVTLIKAPNMKTLVVDDEKDVQILFQQRFRKEIRDNAIEFAFAFSGEEALGYLNEHAHEAVLILSDINMPGMSGLDLLQEIKTKHTTPSPVVMMITAYGDSDNYNRAMELGADDFLTKPLDFNSLKEKLRPLH